MPYSPETRARLARGARPILLIDIDGVLNCFGDLGRSHVSFEDEFTVLDRFRIKVPVGAREALRVLGEAFDCVWATTWEEHANPEIGARLGLTTDWPHLCFDGGPYSITRKLPTVAGYVGARPAAWVDDELHDDAEKWAAERSAAGVPTLLVPTCENVGITAGDVETLLAWARESVA